VQRGRTQAPAATFEQHYHVLYLRVCLTLPDRGEDDFGDELVRASTETHVEGEHRFERVDLSVAEDHARRLDERDSGAFVVAGDPHPPSWPGVFAFAQMGVQSFGNGSRLYALDAHLQPVL